MMRAKEELSLRKFSIYVELDSKGRITDPVRQRVEAYLNLLNQAEVAFAWIYSDKKVSLISVVSIIQYEKKVCAHKGLIVKNKVISCKPIGKTTKKLMYNYKFTNQAGHEAYLDEDICRMCFGNQPESCDYNSCIGNTVVVFCDGSVGVCPFRANDIKLNPELNISDIQDIFNTESFYNLISQSIKKRGICKAKCYYFSVCKGGCPFNNMEEAENCSVALRIDEEAKKIKQIDVMHSKYIEQVVEKLASRYKV